MKFLSTVNILFFTCFVFFFVGFFAYSNFFEILIPGVAGIKYMGELTAVWDKAVLFAIITAFIPALLFITWGLIPLYSLDKKILTAFITIVCAVIAVYMRYKVLAGNLKEISNSFINKNTTNSIVLTFNDLNYEYYFGAGLVTGCIISYLAFHNKTIERRRFYS